MTKLTGEKIDLIVLGRASGVNAKSLAHMCGVSVSSVYQVARNNGVPKKLKYWTTDVESTLTDLWNAGHSVTKIGRMMGISRNAVVGKARRLGLPSRPAPANIVAARLARAAA